MITEIIITLGLILLFCYWKMSTRPTDNYPPGPAVLPVVGTLPLLGKDPVATFQEWKKKYGKIFAIRLGPYEAIIINDYSLIKEAYNDLSFCGRPSLKPLMKIAGGKKRGLVPNDGPNWQEQRRFCLRHLRDFGFGKKSMEGTIQERITDLLDSFQKDLNKPVSIDRRFSLSVLGALWHIITGETISYNDPEYMNILNKFHTIISKVNLGGPMFFFPRFTDWFPEVSGWNSFEKMVDEAKALIQTQIDKHKETFQSDNLRDFIDVYLEEIKNTTDPNSTFFQEEGYEELKVTVLNLFVAGSETTSNTLTWALLLISLKQEVLSKIQAEIERVVGNSRLPGLDDKPTMVYTAAVMEEVFRISSLAPLGIFHNTMKTCNLNGFIIPKDTIVLTNLYGLHYDPNMWVKPEEFIPERFLTTTIEGAIEFELKKDIPPVIPFLIGKRQCLGEVLARSQFFLFLTSICQKYDFKPDPSVKDPKINVHTGLLRVPKDPFKLVFTERNGDVIKTEASSVIGSGINKSTSKSSDKTKSIEKVSSSNTASVPEVIRSSSNVSSSSGLENPSTQKEHEKNE